MPIRIQRVLADPSGLPSQIPGRQASGADFGAQVAEVGYRGGIDLQQQGLHALDQFRRAEAIMRKEEIAADVREKAAAVHVQYADDLGQLRESGADPATYAQQAESMLKARVAEAQGSLRYANDPVAVREFQKHINEFVVTSTIAAKRDGFKARGALVEAQDDLELEKLTRVASMGTPREVGDALGKAQEIINRGVASGRYSGEQAATKSKMVLAGMQMGLVSQDFANPETRQTVVNRLMAGDVPHIGPLAEQQRIARTLQDRADAELTKARAEAKRDWDERKTDALREFSIQATDKTTTIPGIRAFGRQWKLTEGELEHLEKRFTAPAEEPPSNPAVLQDTVLQVNRANPTIGEAAMRQRYDPRAGTGLNTKDFEAQTKVLIARTQHIREYGQTLAMQRYSQAEQEGFLALGIVPQQLETLNPSSKVLISQYIGELSARAFPNPDKKYEDPFAVKNEIIPRYQAALRNKAMADIEEIRATLAFPVRGVDPTRLLESTSQAIEQAFAGGQINRDRYEVEKNKWRQMKEADDQARKIREQIESAGTKTKGPAYTGTRATD
jgi:hypothetical protein